MIKSMTGFGKATGEINNKKVTVEVKSLNSKQADINLRIPSFYKEKELPLRSFINKELQRGKIELNLYVELLDGQTNYQINTVLFKKYYEDLSSIANDLNQTNQTDLMSIIAKLPDVLKSEREELDENEWNGIQAIIEKSISHLNEFRAAEGKSLEEDLKLRINNIDSLLSDVEKFDASRIENIMFKLLIKITFTILSTRKVF